MKTYKVTSLLSWGLREEQEVRQGRRCQQAGRTRRMHPQLISRQLGQVEEVIKLSVCLSFILSMVR